MVVSTEHVLAEILVWIHMAFGPVAARSLVEGI